jgi:hypothetical protein
MLQPRCRYSRLRRATTDRIGTTVFGKLNEPDTWPWLTGEEKFAGELIVLYRREFALRSERVGWRQDRSIRTESMVQFKSLNGAEAVRAVLWSRGGDGGGRREGESSIRASWWSDFGRENAATTRARRGRETVRLRGRIGSDFKTISDPERGPGRLRLGGGEEVVLGVSWSKGRITG